MKQQQDGEKAEHEENLLVWSVKELKAQFY